MIKNTILQIISPDNTTDEIERNKDVYEGDDVIAQYGWECHVMEVLDLMFLIIVIFICIFAITNRICNCIEHCWTLRTFGDFVDENPEFVDRVVGKR